MPFGARASRSCLMYEVCRNTTSSPSTAMSTLRRSDTSASSSTRQRSTIEPLRSRRRGFRRRRSSRERTDRPRSNRRPACRRHARGRAFVATFVRLWPCHRPASVCGRSAAGRRTRSLRTRGADDSRRPRLARVPPADRPRRSLSASCACPSTPPVMRERAEMCLAWLRRMSDRSRRPQLVRSPGRRAVPSWIRRASFCTPKSDARGCGRGRVETCR
eukprot:3344815-Pleurochrysis_carterae.AAC.1